MSAKNRRIFTTLTAALCVLACAPLAASGSYRGRPETSRVDAGRYHLGKQIFTGEIDTKETQSALLNAIAAEVPPADRAADLDVEALAGKLSARELDAMRFHTAVRYGLADLDRERFARGGRILAGDLKGETQARATKELEAAQTRRLEALQARIPEEAKDRINVRDLAGRLSPEGLAALEYHAAVAYKLPAVDQESYDLGGRLLQGERDREQLDHLAAEERRLAALERKLPARSRSTSLTALAGRLTPEELAALEYYLQVRYRVE